MSRHEAPIKVIVITGLSGAGKTVALRALEDVGFFCIDNFPPQLLKNFISLSASGKNIEKVAISVDVRERSFVDGVEESINALREEYDAEVVFLEAESSVLLKRFKETRRPHPLSASSGGDIKDALKVESEYLSFLRKLADRVIDTSSYTPHQLRSFIMETFGGDRKSSMGINIISFGYKFGIPQDVDLLFDVRFLPNPYFITELRELTGLDEQVRRYVMESPLTVKLLDKLKELVEFLVAEYLKEGRSSLTIGVGCTGGQHRSPVIAEELFRYLKSAFDLEIKMIHREL
ncbi:MAG: RNase adapter RapZ [Nitrospirae bacterium]|nr:RNase adapter RapZ [Nitrospirota bacterium]